MDTTGSDFIFIVAEKRQPFISDTITKHVSLFLFSGCCVLLPLYLWFGFLLILVEVELISSEHKPAQLPVLHDAALFLKPASFQRPLLDAGGRRPAGAAGELPHDHALRPSWKRKHTYIHSNMLG